MNSALWVSAVVHGAAYACVLLIIFFKGIGVERHRRFCFWFVMLYKLVFESVTGMLESLPEYETMSQLRLLDSMLYTTGNFVFLAVVCICGRGTLPQNFIKITIYIYQANIAIAPLMYLADRLTLPYSEADWQVALAGIGINLLFVLEILFVCRLASGWLDRMVRRIPDMLSRIFFILACIVFVGEECFLAYKKGYVVVGARWENVYLFIGNRFLILTFLLISVLLIFYIKNQYKSRRIRYAENHLMLEYYRNSSSLYREVRKLRHDLSNHISAAENQLDYRKSIESVCDRIQQSVARQMAWRNIRIKQISDRERYEVYQYLMEIIHRYHLPEDALQICFDDHMEELRSVILHCSDSHGGSGTKKICLRKLKHHPMYHVVCQIASRYGKTLEWRKRGTDFILELH